MVLSLVSKPDVVNCVHRQLKSTSSRSIATAFAPNATTFIIFVALKGMGAAANTPAGIGILSTYFPPGPKRSKAFGAVGAGQPLGFIGGLVVGAFPSLMHVYPTIYNTNIF